eukprot:4948714-Pleurochrysis_carterae.AAC.2
MDKRSRIILEHNPEELIHLQVIAANKAPLANEKRRVQPNEYYCKCACCNIEDELSMSLLEATLNDPICAEITYLILKHASADLSIMSAELVPKRAAISLS